MKNQKENFFKKNKKFRYLAIILVIVGVYGVQFSFAKATPSPAEIEAIKNMSEEEKQAFMKKNGGTEGNFGMENVSGKENSDLAGVENVTEMTQEEIDKKAIEAKMAFERNQTRLKIAKNIATSTVAQLKLEGTDVEELQTNLDELEKRMDEIEALYKNYLSQIRLFGEKRGENPGDIKNIFKQAREKKASLLDFYKNTFRSNFEDALARNQREKEAIK